MQLSPLPLHPKTLYSADLCRFLQNANTYVLKQITSLRIFFQEKNMSEKKEQKDIYSETLEYLFNSLPVFEHTGGGAYKPGLQTIRELDEFYGSPHRCFKTIHIAGTNGKGSVAHILAAILQGAGYKTGLFTSPHLIDFRERIRINAQMITKNEVIEFVKRSRKIFDKVQPSFFEMTVAMAFDYFAREKVDIAVIETGMGGRLDATNIINPILSVITNISMDHAQFLGNNLISIATEKAGIIKQGTPVVIGEKQPGTHLVFEQMAMKTGSQIVFADQQSKIDEWRPNADKTGQVYYLTNKGSAHPFSLVADLYGNYQKKNIITALIATQMMRLHKTLEIETSAILQSLPTVAKITGLKGRWQKLCDKPLIICDTGHNKAAWTYILQQIEQCRYKKLHLVIGFAKDKAFSEILEMMPRDAVYYFTKAANPRALNETELMNAAAKYKLKGSAYPNVRTALKTAQRTAIEQDMIFIGGSTFVVAEVI